jgi:Flp pilus assembly protein TadD
VTCAIPKFIATGLFVLIFLAHSAQTVRQIRVWENSLTLWQHAVEVSPLSGMAHSMMGATLAQCGRCDLAVPELVMAVAIDPHDAYARNNLGVCLAKMGAIIGARHELRRAVEISGDRTASENLRHLPRETALSRDEILLYPE